MVFYFTASDGTMLYMGADKFENEILIENAWPEDVWWHVDKLSSAHVYCRLATPEAWLNISPELLEDCVQLVKANSIQGNKENDLDVVYTPASNLKKTSDMAVGQVGFKDGKLVKKARVARRVNEIVNRLNKTQVEKHPDLAEEKRVRDQAEQRKKKQAAKEDRKTREAEVLAREQEKRERSYDTLFSGAAMRSNRDIDEDDFM